MTQQELQLIRRSIKKHIGDRIRLSANQGRHRFETSEGVILETYPNIFVVQIISENPEKNHRKVSFSYHDVITKDVRMVLLSAKV
jgi:uncharacterized protein Veg